MWLLRWYSVDVDGSHLVRAAVNILRCLDFTRKMLPNFLPHFFPMHIYHAAAAAAKSLQSCPTLCDPIDGSPPDSAIPGILQARTLEWVAISFSNA